MAQKDLTPMQKTLGTKKQSNGINTKPTVPNTAWSMAAKYKDASTAKALANMEVPGSPERQEADYAASAIEAKSRSK